MIVYKFTQSNQFNIFNIYRLNYNPIDINIVTNTRRHEFYNEIIQNMYY